MSGLVEGKLKAGSGMRAPVQGSGERAGGEQRWEWTDKKLCSELQQSSVLGRHTSGERAQSEQIANYEQSKCGRPSVTPYQSGNVTLVLLLIWKLALLLVRVRSDKTS